MNKFVAVMMVGLALLGCDEKKAIAVKQTNNSGINLELLFEHDGIKVYRFYDSSYPVYFTDARGGAMWNQAHVVSTGKTTYVVHRPKEVPTSK